MLSNKCEHLIFLLSIAQGLWLRCFLIKRLICNVFIQYMYKGLMNKIRQVGYFLGQLYISLILKLV